MSWLPDIFGWNSGAQSYSEATANIQQQEAKYAAQLQQRLRAGQISQQYFDSEMFLVRQQLQDPTDAGWNEFQQQIAVEAAKLPQTISNGVKDAATWAGDTVGGAIGGASSGLFNGILSKLNWKMWLAILGGVALLWWAFTRGPLKGAKLKIIPFPL